jgi:hypothetical protein
MRSKESALKAMIVLGIFCLSTVFGLPQQQVGIPTKIKDGYVLEFPEPYNRLVLDIGETNFTTRETTEVEITADTQFMNKRGIPIEKSVVRPGMELEIQGERFGTHVVARTVKVITNIENWEVEVKGYFEKLEGDIARIDGQAVVLGQGVVIQGDKEWKGKQFRSFSEMMLGSEVEIKGIRQPDGLIIAKEGKTRPNVFTGTDKKLIKAAQDNLALPPSNKLAGGKVKIGNKEFKLVESLELQSYVTQVGYKVIPHYVKDMPREDPGKLTYRFYVIEDDSFNAFALPDGSVFVHTGLLKMLKNEAQLAAVLGHEIAHVTYEHSSKRWGKLLVLSSISQVTEPVLKEFGLKTIGDLVKFGLGVFSNKFSRDMENQADRVGLFYMFEAGYDPREAPKVWRELLKVVKEDAVSNFLYSDHPSARARLRNLNREIAYNYYNADLREKITGEEEYYAAVGRYLGMVPPRRSSSDRSGNTSLPPRTSLVGDSTDDRRSGGVPSRDQQETPQKRNKPKK